MKETKDKILSLRVLEKTNFQINELSEKLKMPKSEIMNIIFERGLNNFFYENKDEIYEIVKDIKNSRDRKVIISFFSLIKFDKNEYGKASLENINTLAETNLSKEDFTEIFEKYSLKDYFQDIEITDTKRMDKKMIDGFFKTGDQNFKFENIPSEILIKTQRKIKKEG